MSPSLLLSMNCSEVSILKATCQRSPLIQRRNPGEVVGYLQSGEVMMLTLTSGDERTFYFVEYYAEWAEKAKTMATKDERSLWVKSTQTTARQVCSVLKAWGYTINLLSPVAQRSVRSVGCRASTQPENTCHAGHRRSKDPVSTIGHWIFCSMTPRLCRVAERVTALGWAEEVEKMEPYSGRYQFQNLPLIEKMYRKEITDHGRFFYNSLGRINDSSCSSRRDWSWNQQIYGSPQARASRERAVEIAFGAPYHLGEGVH